MARAGALQALGCGFESRQVHMQWEVIELVNSVHVVPIDDLLSHNLSTSCLCGPVLAEEIYHDSPNDKPVWMHDAFDKRDAE